MLGVAEDVGVARDHLRLQAPVDRVGVHRAVLFRNHDLEGEVQEEVAQLALELVGVSVPDGVHDLVGLLQEVGNERLGRLLGVPGTLGPKMTHQGQGPVECARPGKAVFGVGHGGSGSGVVCGPCSWHL